MFSRPTKRNANAGPGRQTTTPLSLPSYITNTVLDDSLIILRLLKFAHSLTRIP
jgi:hypothetical protein